MANKTIQANLYYPVFRSIEREIVELSRVIYFSDEQINVYSIKISELLSRCSMEIESLLKDLYRKEFDAEPESVGQAATALDMKWGISKKELKITTDSFYFTTLYSPYFAPLGYKNRSKDDYYAAYNAIKHDRAKNLHKANINSLVRALGSLYILNIYYSASVLVSEVFTAKTAGQAMGIFMGLGLNLKTDLDSCLLIEYHEFAYFSWLETNSPKLNSILKSLNEEDRRFITEKVIRDSSNVFGIMNSLFFRNNRKSSIGETLSKAREASRDFEDAPTIAINTGYERIYISLSEMKKNITEIKNPEKVLSWKMLSDNQRLKSWDL